MERLLSVPDGASSHDAEAIKALLAAFGPDPSPPTTQVLHSLSAPPLPPGTSDLPLPPLGKDEEFDRLFESRVFLRVAQYLDASSARDFLGGSSPPPLPNSLEVLWQNPTAVGLCTPVWEFDATASLSPLSNLYTHSPVAFTIPEECGRKQLELLGHSPHFTFTRASSALALCKASAMGDYELYLSLIHI